ncbi:putative mfs transporter protein [Eutypa lata UCREL1]|uniref:Putative mfs transporter protein n=1 Tax=Eutypa lata (strain UCR-EL1) TaxID=1287681 RepID=M7T5E7_EUTLA|nr:putative mfs transporter protein [Eutypa lata UCREL1]
MAKGTVSEVGADGTAIDYAAIVTAWSSEERAEREKKFLRKIDYRLLPILIVMYVLNYIDRNALPQARIQGIEKDIGLVGVEYNIVLSLTFIGYILAPFFAGVAFLFSGWYTRKELGLRLGIFFCAAMFSGAFGGLFAAGIQAAFADNPLGSWRFLFIIEGAATVFFACLTAFVIPDWPATTKWLSEEEKALGVIRLIEDAGEEETEIKTMDAFKMAAKDYRVWLCILGQMCLQAVASLTNFLPTLVKAFGYSTINTLLLTAPPYIFTAFFCLYNTWHSDKTSTRSPHIIYPTIGAIVGIIITIATTNNAARYFALFLMLPGTYGCFQISNAWMANIAARPQKKRAIGLAMNNAIGNLALVWTPYLYPESDGPRYLTAWSVNLALAVVTLVSSVILSWCLRKDNKKLEEAIAAGWTVEEGEGVMEQKAGLAAHHEAPTAGRPLGGNKAGAVAKYDI